MNFPCALGNDTNNGLLLLREEGMKPAGINIAPAPGAVKSPACAVGDMLQALTCSDNEARNRAEQAFNAFKESHPEMLVLGLLEVSIVITRCLCARAVYLW